MTDESRELATGKPGRRLEGRDGGRTLDASWELAKGRAGRCDDRLDCETINDEDARDASLWRFRLWGIRYQLKIRVTSK